MPPGPSLPASMPTGRNTSRIGMPKREPKALTRILTATSNAPIRNRLLMALASTGVLRNRRRDGSCLAEPPRILTRSFGRQAKKRPAAVRGVLSVRQGRLEPRVLHIQASVVAGFEDGQVVLAAGHFPGQEVARGLQFALVEGCIGRVSLTVADQCLALFGADRL